MVTIEVAPIDHGDLEGGLVRMMHRFRREGTMTGDLEEDAFLRRHPEAALLGMLFDQRMLAEGAFTGPHRLMDRLGHLDMRRIAAMDLDELRREFAKKPAVHRFTNRMAEYTWKLARLVTERYDGDVSRIWNDGSDWAAVEARVRELPGFGPLKALKMKFVLHYFGYRDFSNGG